jgi:DNA-binding transcriptional LysR family regulator
VVFRVNDCEMFQALVAAGVGVGFLPRLALHPLHPGVVIKAVEGSPRRRILAVTLPAMRSPASAAFLDMLDRYAAAYPKLRDPARA